MAESSSRLDLLDSAVTQAVRRGIAQRSAEDGVLEGRTIRLDGRDLLYFASCSYLGLELDPRLRRGAIEATLRYGTQFSSSRVYVSAPLYPELEALLERIFEAPVVVCPSTTLGHLCAIPTLVAENDAVVMDHQVHHSVQTACAQVRAAGTHVELLRHGRIDLLVERVRELAARHRSVWYMADGVYSMYGDLAAFQELGELLDRFERFRLYIDDAHGMSWSGRHGRGVTLSHMALHPRMVMATSLNKAFAAAGGVIVVSDAELRRRIRTCGGPLLFSGPIQPPLLGAAVASARIHLSEEIAKLQERLRRRIALCRDLLRERELPVLSSGEAPIFFVGTGLTATAQNLCGRLMRDGLYANVAQFPAVSTRGAGVRFTLTLHNRDEDIRRMVDAIDRHFEAAIEEEGQSPAETWKAFGLEPRTRGRWRRGTSLGPGELRLEKSDSIESFAPAEWDALLGGRGAFDWQGLRFLERCFHGGRDPANAWRFRYYRVRDQVGRTRLLTFFTEAPWKADMLASAEISRAVEERRKSDPEHLTLRTFAMGSLLTEGDHLYLAREPGWKQALELLLAAVTEEAEAADAELVALRDLPDPDPELRDVLEQRGFLRLPAPESMVAELSWADEEELLRSLSPKARYHQRRCVAPWNDAYEVEILGAGTRALSEEEAAHLHRLYRNVKEGNLTLNTFELPRDLFAWMLRFPCWEIALFRAKDQPPGAAPVAFGASFVGREHVVPTVIGLDYRYVRSHGLYRQCLRQALLRGRELGKRRVHLGMGAPLEKRRFGARPVQSALYLQARDLYAFDALEVASGGRSGT
jgi:7-keto-8-aminopelargonate synthetase-like enzyme